MLTPAHLSPHPTDGPPDPFLPPDLDPGVFATFRAFIRIGHAHRQLITSLMGEAGGHPAQAGCLRALDAQDGLSQRDLARILFLTPPSITTMVQRMEKAGFVERRPDPDDQRLTRVHLTDTGRALATKVKARFGEHLTTMFGGFSRTELEQLQSLLSRMADNITTETPTKAAE
jgi:DNA-binding MarR family transcriptional regulator